MSPSPGKVLRRLGWLSAAAALVAAPKCLLCLAAYAGVGALFGIKLVGPELCGATASSPSSPILWIAVAASIAGAMFAAHALHRRRPSLSEPQRHGEHGV